MPESSSRKKKPHRNDAAKETMRTSKDIRFEGGNGNKPNAVWFKPVMFGLFLVGLVWVVTYYISEGTYPVPALGNGNIFAGFGFILAGFLMTTQWRS